MSSKINSWDWDVRVRERNIRNGTLKESDVEKMLGALTDVTEQMDNVSLTQPALLRGAGAEWDGSNNG